MMRRSLAVLVAALLALMLHAGPVRAEDPQFPPLTGPLVDAADLLPPTARDEFDR